VLYNAHMINKNEMCLHNMDFILNEIRKHPLFQTNPYLLTRFVYTSYIDSSIFTKTGEFYIADKNLNDSEDDDMIYMTTSDESDDGTESINYMGNDLVDTDIYEDEEKESDEIFD
jgi:hypothetical protein